MTNKRTSYPIETQSERKAQSQACLPSVDLPLPEHAPPGEDAKDENDARSKQADPAEGDSHQHKHIGVLGHNSTCTVGHGVLGFLRALQLR